MAFDLKEWADIAAIISAMTDVFTTGLETFQYFYEARRSAPDATRRGEILRNAFSTYSDDEIKSIERRLKACRDRFINEGDGPQRRRCFCSVLGDVKDGNGGSIPIPDWDSIYKTLGCPL
jgi:hypothetical protein